MKPLHLLFGTALAATSAWALAQQAPESLLPPGFDKPERHAPRAEPAPERTAAAPARSDVAVPAPAPSIAAQPLVETAPGAPATNLPAAVRALPDLASLPPDQLDQLLGLKPRYDIPPGARRSMQRVGVIGSGEDGLPPFSLARQDGSLVEAAIAGNSGKLVSRWGHILLRRALASRLDAPAGMDPADFAALRAALLLRMGEGDAARALVQDVDPQNYNPALTQAALDAYVASADLTGICPVVALQGGARKDGQWQVLKAICAAFSGNAAGGFAQLDHLTYVGAMPRIDMLLAQKYAGAAGVAGKGGRRAVTIEWDGVDGLTPWRYALTIATGLTPPAALMQGAGGQYDDATALAPMVGLGLRADASDRAGGTGVLSSAAMVDLYSQIYDDDDVTDAPADRALLLRDAYTGVTPDARLTAMKQLWDGGSGPLQRYAREVLTAYACARLPVSSDMAKDAGDIIASMLAAGLDANALRWSGAVDPGSLGWALLALANPSANGPVDGGALNSFVKNDGSAGSRKSTLLLAGLAGLGRVAPSARRDVTGKLSVDLDHPTRWTQMIDQAAAVNNPTLVALLAGLGMQGDGWDKMTPRYLYHIVGALNRVGLSAEARMIAAEAVARG